MLSLQLSDNLQLKLLEEQDAEALYSVISANRAHLTRWIDRFAAVTSVDIAKQVILMSLQGFANDTNYAFGIWYNGELVGNVAYTHFEKIIRKAAISYWIAATYEGKGLVTESTRALVNYAFRERNLNRIVIYCATENTRSRNVPERLGFKLEGILRQADVLHGDFVDLAVYSILAEEWAAKL